MATNKEPELQDEVKHKTADMSGIVIAKYPKSFILRPTKWLLDIRRVDEKIEYGTPMENWEVVRTAFERGQV